MISESYELKENDYILSLKKKTSDIFDFERKRKVMLKGNGSINESLEQQYELTFIISDLFLFFSSPFSFQRQRRNRFDRIMYNNRLY
jgi:hypothetical protein